MTNREWLEKHDNDFLASLFCYELAKDGEFCDTKCPFKDLCVGGESGIKIWLEKEYKGD